MHGGISPALNDLNDIKKILRPTDVPESGLLTDLLWSDPKPSTKEWEPSDRGVSYHFNAKSVNEFLEKHNLDLICRAH